MAVENLPQDTGTGGTLVALPVQGGSGGQGEDTEKSLAAILRAQYTSREFNDVFGSTELREHEVIIIAGMFMVRFISLIIATTQSEEQGLDQSTAEYKNVHARVEIKKRLMSDPNAMVFAQIDAWLYAFGLCRQSLKRQSRTEGMQISSASILRQLGMDGQNIGYGAKFMSKIGIGPYRTAYIPKNMPKE